MLDAENDWNDPRNEFPAILFRLSYRTNDEYRSGYRDGDEEGEWPQPVVNSMRGWWEIPPDEVEALAVPSKLNVRYAVATHEGLTRAVVRVDGWHWVAGLMGDDHHRMSVDDVLRGDHAGKCEFGHLEDRRWRTHERVRWGFGAKDAPGGARKAWMGGDGVGTQISGMRRDTLASVWPYSLASDPRDLVERSLRILATELRSHLDAKFGGDDVEAWRQNVAREWATRFRQASIEPSDDDPSLWLQILEDEWSRVHTSFRPLDWSLFSRLRRLRDDWAHFAREHASDAVARSLDDLRQLLNVIGASNAARNVSFMRQVVKAQDTLRN